MVKGFFRVFEVGKRSENIIDENVLSINEQLYLLTNSANGDGN